MARRVLFARRVSNDRRIVIFPGARVSFLAVRHCRELRSQAFAPLPAPVRVHLSNEGRSRLPNLV